MSPTSTVVSRMLRCWLCMICRTVRFFLLWVFSVHANEHLESDSIDPSTAMLSLSPRLWCLLSLFSELSVITTLLSSRCSCFCSALVCLLNVVSFCLFTLASVCIAICLYVLILPITLTSHGILPFGGVLFVIFLLFLLYCRVSGLMEVF